MGDVQEPVEDMWERPEGSPIQPGHHLRRRFGEAADMRQRLGDPPAGEHHTWVTLGSHLGHPWDLGECEMQQECDMQQD